MAQLMNEPLKPEHVKDRLLGGQRGPGLLLHPLWHRLLGGSWGGGV